MSDKLQREIDLLAEKCGFSVIRFECSEEIFGNIILNIEIHGRELSFITDRGEICCNGSRVTGYEYLTKEGKTTAQKLLEIVEAVIDSSENNA